MKLSALVLPLTLTLASAATSVAAEFLDLERRFDLGVVGGFSNKRNTGQVELVAGYKMWEWGLGENWSVASGCQGTVGWIGDDRLHAVIGSLGPTAKLTREGIPVSLIAGSAPTLVGRNRLADRNIGSAFQFTSFVGLAWDVTGRFQASYWYQHMSNAGLGDPNPGLNMHMFGFRLRL